MPLVALLELPGMGPARLAALLAERTAEHAWQKLCQGWVPQLSGVPRAVAAGWPAAARAIDVDQLAERYARAGVTVLAPGDPGFPERLRDDVEAPALLFSLGEVEAVCGPAVALIGTRRATRYGLDMAAELGRDLRVLGITVVSGLAAGIDGAAHRGALSAGGGPVPVGIVGSGLDRPYPASNRQLWHQMGECGVLLSEAPLGSAPEPWRFPARNRLIAALSEVVVIVESYESGGSLITAEYADDRGRTLLAVPGSARSPASSGTHTLLRTRDARLCTSAVDVLAALKLALPGAGAPAESSAATTAGGGSSPDHDVILALVGWEPISFDALARRSTFSLPRLAGLVQDLLSEGLLDNRDGFLVCSD